MINLSSSEMNGILRAIEVARLHKDFVTSGAIQKLLDAVGYAVIDTEINGEPYSAATPTSDLQQPQPTVDDLIEQRQQARSLKDWKTADTLRSEIERRSGKRVVDSADGMRLV